MNEEQVDLHRSLDWVAEYHGLVLSEFQAQHRVLPSWGPVIDQNVKTYVERLGQFMRGIDCWAFETERYFGTKGREVQKQRIVTLLPKKGESMPTITPGRRLFDILNPVGMMDGCYVLFPFLRRCMYRICTSFMVC